MKKLDTEIKPMNNLEEGSDVQDVKVVKMTSRLKNNATKKMNHMVGRIIQLPSKYSQGLKAPNMKNKQKHERQFRKYHISFNILDRMTNDG